MRRSLLLFFILACSPAYAELIKVVAVGSQISYDDPLGLLPFPAPPAGSAMTLTFVYDSETPDVDPDAEVGMYAGAISSMTLMVGASTLSALPENYILVIDGLRTDHDGDGVPDEVNADLWVATTFLEGPPYSTEMNVVLVRPNGDAIDSDALIAPGSPSSWGLNFIVYGIVDRSGPDDPIFVASAQTYFDSLTVTTIPLPASSLLLLPCLLTIAPWLRRRAEAAPEGSLES